MNIETYNRYFLSILEHGSLTRAASHLGISQPALSMALNTLEKQLGYPLFNRKTNPFSLTEEGEAYASYVDKQMILKQDYERRIAELHQTPQEQLVIGGRAHSNRPVECKILWNEWFAWFTRDEATGTLYYMGKEVVLD